MKRLDLQAIRGVAILLVLAFHLQPHRFPLGFVGVDMFFVLSGYLMALILSKEEMQCNTFSLFFLRRFKRIVPIYYLTLLGVYAGCAYLLIPSDKEQLVKDLKWALPFGSNIQPFFEVKGYWDQISSYRFLVHCWSLGVEMQFYLLAPFLIIFSNRLSPNLRCASLLVIAVSSALFQMLTDSKVSYDLLPSRIWQFVLGILCFTRELEPTEAGAAEKEKLIEESGSENNDEDDEPQCTRTIIFSEAVLGLLIILVLANSSAFLTVKVMRLLSCLTICIVIYWPVPLSKSLLSNFFLIYVGDLSYSMYLIHWPVIVAVKYYYNVKVLTLTETLLLFGVIFLVTVIVHHLVEKPITSSRTIVGFLICLGCVVTIHIFAPNYSECCQTRRENVSVEKIDVAEAIVFNLYESQKVYYPIPCDPDNVTAAWTNYTEEPPLTCQSYGNGSLKILVIGNSIAYRAYPLIHEIFKGRYKELRLYSRSSSLPLTDIAPGFTAAAQIVAENIRPDVIWNIHCQLEDELIRPFVNKSTDPAFLTFQKHLDFYVARTKYFIIDLPYYWAHEFVSNEMARRLQLSLPLNDLNISRPEAEEQQKHHRARLLALNCSICDYNDVEEMLWEEDIYWYYNRQNLHAYTKEGNHFTPEGLKRLKPLYERRVEGILERLGR